MAKTKHLSTDAWRDYRQKAGVLLEASDVCLEFGLLDAAAILAIHSAILHADAVLIRNAGIRSASGDHEDVLELLAARLPQSKAARRQLSTLIATKNQVEYTGEKVTDKEAADLNKRAKRFASWCREFLPA